LSRRLAALSPLRKANEFCPVADYQVKAPLAIHILSAHDHPRALRFMRGFHPGGANPASLRKKVHMIADDRRYTQRLKLRIPLRICSGHYSDAPPQAVESSDISARGFYFLTDLPLRVGSPLQVFLRMPREIAGKPSPEWCCTCRVVRVDQDKSDQGKREQGNTGIGVEIQYYEVLKA
jgi:hypothetical protein